MLFSVLKKISFKGKIDIVDSKGKIHSFGSSNLSVPYVRIKIKKKSFERKFIFNPTLHLGEGYMNQDLIIEEGTIDNLIAMTTSFYDDFVSKHWLQKIYTNVSSFLRSLHQLNDHLTSRKNVAHHYDINEELYRLFLDKDMQYSCGYFYNDNINLEQAQIDKKNHIIKKLDIKKDMKVLDIGCGWGGLALQIAKDTGAKVKGITLSKNQFLYAKKRAEREGLEDKVKFVLQDYRNENEYYDRIVSVGMFEHVGINYFSNFFSKTYDLLKDNGVFLLHTIGSKGRPFATNPWMRKYIFPGGYIPSLSEIIQSTEKNNVLVTDIEVLRLHYAKTLKHWYKNFVKNRKKIIEMFDERFCRMWEFYLLASYYSFVNMGNVVFQIQISKNINNLPLTRNYMYN